MVTDETSAGAKPPGPIGDWKPPLAWTKQSRRRRARTATSQNHDEQRRHHRADHDRHRLCGKPT